MLRVIQAYSYILHTYLHFYVVVLLLLYLLFIFLTQDLIMSYLFL